MEQLKFIQNNYSSWVFSIFFEKLKSKNRAF